MFKVLQKMFSPINMCEDVDKEKFKVLLDNRIPIWFYNECLRDFVACSYGSRSIEKLVVLNMFSTDGFKRIANNQLLREASGVCDFEWKAELKLGNCYTHVRSNIVHVGLCCFDDKGFNEEAFKFCMNKLYYYLHDDFRYLLVMDLQDVPLKSVVEIKSYVPFVNCFISDWFEEKDLSNIMDIRECCCEKIGNRWFKAKTLIPTQSIQNEINTKKAGKKVIFDGDDVRIIRENVVKEEFEYPIDEYYDDDGLLRGCYVENEWNAVHVERGDDVPSYMLETEWTGNAPGIKYNEVFDPQPFKDVIGYDCFTDDVFSDKATDLGLNWVDENFPYLLVPTKDYYPRDYYAERETYEDFIEKMETNLNLMDAGVLVERPSFKEKYNVAFNIACGNLPPDDVDFKVVNDWFNNYCQVHKLELHTNWLFVENYWVCFGDVKTESTAQKVDVGYTGFGKTKQQARNEVVYIFYLEHNTRLSRTTLEGALPTLDGTEGTTQMLFSVGDMPQVEADQGQADEEGLQVISAEANENTVLTVASGSERVDNPKPVETPITFDHVVGGVHEFPKMADRYVTLKTDTIITPDSGRGTIVRTINVPRDFLADNPKAPVNKPFQIYALTRPNMTVRMETNTTKFHGGTIVIAARYSDYPNSGYEPSSAQELLSMGAARIQCCSSNKAEVPIPYINPHDWLTTKNTQAGPGNYYATVYVGILNRITIGTGGTREVTLKFRAKFSVNGVNTQFAMQRVHRLLYDQGDCNDTVRALTYKYVKGDGPVMSVVGSATEVIGAAAGAIDIVKGTVDTIDNAVQGIGGIFKAGNQDRSLVPFGAVTIQPQPIPDMALGSGPIELTSMRLHKQYRTPFPPDAIPIEDQFKIEFLKQVKNVVLLGEWSTADVKGTLLGTIKNTPIQYSLVGGGQVLFPTITELAFNFEHWSGCLGLEFVFGASQMHSGRIVLVFDPDGDTEPDFDDYESYWYIVYDLQEQQIFSTNIPNPCPTLLTPICEHNEVGEVLRVYNYGNLYIFVENPLVQIDSIGNSVDFYVTMSMPNDSYFHVLSASKIAQETENMPGVFKYKKVVGNMDDPRTDVGDPIQPLGNNIGREAVYGEPNELYSAARRFACAYYIEEEVTTAGPAYALAFDVNWSTNTTSNVYANKFKYKTLPQQLSDGFRFFKGGKRYIFEIIGRDSATVMHSPMTYTSSGSLITPESLTTNCANWAQQMVGLKTVNNMIAIDIPWTSNQHFLINRAPSHNNFSLFAPYRYSNGQVLLILSGEVGTFKIKVWEAMGDDASMFVFQGFPPRSALSCNGNYNNYVDVMHVGSDSLDWIVMLGELFGNASGWYVDEIPLGVPTSLSTIGATPHAPGELLTLRSDAGKCWVIWDSRDVGFTVDPENSPAGTILVLPENYWYDEQGNRITSNIVPGSIAGTLTVQGSAATEVDGMVVEGNMSDIDQDFPIDACDLSVDSYQAMKKILTENRRKFGLSKRKVSKICNRKLVDIKLNESYRRSRKGIFFSEVEGNMFQAIGSVVSTASGMFMGARATATLNRVDSVATNMNENTLPLLNGLLTNCNDFVSFISDSVQNFVGRFYGVSNSIFSSVCNNVISMCSHLYSIFFSTQVTVKIANFIGLFSGVFMNGLEYVKNLGIKLYEWFTTRPEVVVEGNAPEDDAPNNLFEVSEEETLLGRVVSWFKFAVPLFVSLLGFQFDYKKFGMSGAFRNIILNSVKCSNDFSRFIGFNIEYIKELCYWWYGKSNPEYATAAVVSEEKENMIKWFEAVDVITQGHMRDRVMSSRGMQKHLDLLFIEGRKYMQLITAQRLNASVFLTMYKKLCELHSSVGQRVGRGNLIREPVVVEISGAPGVGKSNVIANIMTELMIDQGIVYDGPCIFTRNFTEYWNGWADQPCVIYDDFMQVRTPETMDRVLNEFFSLTSVAEFNAPLPAIEDKDRMVNPDFVGLSTNFPYAADNSLAKKQALHRRMDIKVSVRMDPTYVAKYNPPIVDANDERIPVADLSAFKHIQFVFLDKFEDKIEAPFDWMSYDEIMPIIKNRAAQITQRRKTAATSRLQSSLALTPDQWQVRLSRDQDNIPEVIRNQVVDSLQRDPATLTNLIEHTENLVGTSDRTTVFGSVEGNCDICFLNERDWPPAAPIQFEDMSGHNDPRVDTARSCICNSDFFRRFDVCARTWSYVLKRGDLEHAVASLYFRDGQQYIRFGLGDFCSDRCQIQEQHHLQRLASKRQHLIDRGLAEVNSASAILHYLAITETRCTDIPDEEQRNRLADIVGDDYVAVEQVRRMVGERQNDRVAGFRAWISWITTTFVSIVVVFSALALCVMVMNFVYKLVDWVVDLVVSRDTIWNVVNKIFLRVMTCLAFRRGLAAVTNAIGDIAASGDVSTRAGQVVQRVVGNWPDEDVAVSQLLDPREQNLCNINKSIARNVCFLDVRNKDRVGFTARIFGLKGQIAICPFHYSTKLKQYESYECNLIRKLGQSIVKTPINITGLRFMRLAQLDLMLVKLPDRVSPFSDITGMIADNDTAGYVKDNLRLVVVDKNYSMEVFNIDSVQRVESKEMKYDGCVDIHLYGYLYDNFEGSGKCMVPLVKNDRNVIVGFHTTGFPLDKKGATTVFTKEMFTKAITKFCKIYDMVVMDDIIKTGTPILKVTGDMALLGQASQKEALNVSVKTKIKQSPMFGLFPISRFPARLCHKGDVVPGYGPLEVGIAKQGNVPKPFPEYALKLAREYMLSIARVKCLPVCKVESKREFRECIIGKPGFAFMEGLRLNTSPGWPLCSLKPGSKKNDFITINSERTDCTLKSELVQLVEALENSYKKGIVGFSPYADFLKDERLKEGKDTRLINGCSLQNTILWKSYCGDFFAAYQRAGLDVGSAIGINIFGSGMNDIANKLLTNSNIIMDGDFTAFGPTLMPEAIAIVRDMCMKWYRYQLGDKVSPQDELVRYCLFSSLINCVHVAGDCFYQTLCGSPSGSPITAPINTLVHTIYLVCVWMIRFKERGLANLHAFDKYFKYVLYGDDGIYSIHPKMSELFNVVVIGNILERYNIKFTDSSKMGTIKYQTLDKCSFLKCAFKLHPTRRLWLAALEPTVIEDIINWVRLPVPDMDALLEDNALAMSRFAFHHGPDYYATVVQTLMEGFEKRGKIVHFPDWQSLDDLFDSGNYPWPDQDFLSNVLPLALRSGW